MRLENLVLAENEEANRILRELIERLPEGTIKGLGKKNQRMVYARTKANGEVVGLKIGGLGPLNPIPINVIIPENCAEEETTKEYAYFRFLGCKYTVYFR